VADVLWLEQVASASGEKSSSGVRQHWSVGSQQVIAQSVWQPCSRGHGWHTGNRKVGQEACLM